MEILLVSYGSMGDVRPLLALGLALRERGAHVRVCAPPDSRPLFTAAGIPFAPLGGNVRQLMDARADRFVGRPLAAMAPMTRTLRQELAIQFRQLPEVVKSADMVIGSGLALAVPSVAEACGVPYRYAFSIPALLPSRDHAPVTVRPEASLREFIDRCRERGLTVGTAESCTGGLIGKHQCRLRGHRPGHGDPLPLPTRELVRITESQSGRKAHDLHHFLDLVRIEVDVGHGAEQSFLDEGINLFVHLAEAPGVMTMREAETVTP